MKTLRTFFSTLLVLAVFIVLSTPVKAQDETQPTKSSKGWKIEKMGDDSVMICFGKHEFKDFPMHDAWKWSTKRKKYNGHWAGVELGWNGYVNNDFTMDFPANQQYLNMNVARSLFVNVNPFEINLNLANNRFGLTSGLGFTFNNYYFTQNYKWLEDSTLLTAYRVYDDKGNPVDLKVNKLTVSWLTVPILFEYQTNAKMNVKSFHFTLGVIGAVRIGTYQKQEFNTWNTFYYLKDENGNTVQQFYANDKYIRDKGAFYLNSFKLDATARIGWSFLNFFATYSLTPMFQKNLGPKLYPWSVGITLAGW